MQEPVEPQIIDKGMPTPALLAHTLVSVQQRFFQCCLRSVVQRLASFTSSSPKTALQGIATVEVPAITSVASIQSGQTFPHRA